MKTRGLWHGSSRALLKLIIKTNRALFMTMKLGGYPLAESLAIAFRPSSQAFGAGFKPGFASAYPSPIIAGMERVRSEDAEIVYEVRGSGPAVVLLHPFPSA